MRTAPGWMAAFLGLSWAGPAPAEIADEYLPVVEPVHSALRACLGAGGGPEEDRACKEPADRLCLEIGPAEDTTFGMAMCSQVLLAFWDGELNRLWPGVEDAMSRLGEATGAAMLAEQRAWIAYRDATCARVREETAGGSWRAFMAGYCRADMTADRVILFRDLIGLYGGGRNP